MEEDDFLNSIGVDYGGGGGGESYSNAEKDESIVPPEVVIQQTWENSDEPPVRTRLAEVTEDGRPAMLRIDATPSLLFEEFKCPICLGIMEKAYVTMGCLHRFCCECLQRALRVDLGDNAHHSCPSCRGKLASRRAATHDLEFDMLINEVVNNSIPAAEGAAVDVLVDSSAAAEVRNQVFTSSNISPRSHKRIDVEIDLKTYRKQHEANVEMLKAKARVVASNTVSKANSLQGLVTLGIHHVSKLGRASVTGTPRLPRSKRQVALEIVRLPYLKLPPQLLLGDLKKYLSKKLQGNTYQTIVTKQQALLAKDLVAGKGLGLESEGVAKGLDSMADGTGSRGGVGLTAVNRRVEIRDFVVESLDIGIFSRGQMVVCEDKFTIKYICQHLWDRQTPLILYFDAVWKGATGRNPFEREDDEEEEEEVAGSGAKGAGKNDDEMGEGAWRPSIHQRRSMGELGKPRSRKASTKWTSGGDDEDYSWLDDDDSDEKPVSKKKSDAKRGRKRKSMNDD